MKRCLHLPEPRPERMFFRFQETAQNFRRELAAQLVPASVYPLAFARQRDALGAPVGRMRAARH